MAEQRVGELSANEKLLQETLLTAQSMGEEVRQAAVREAEVLIREAEVPVIAQGSSPRVLPSPRGTQITPRSRSQNVRACGPWFRGIR